MDEKFPDMHDEKLPDVLDEDELSKHKTEDEGSKEIQVSDAKSSSLEDPQLKDGYVPRMNSGNKKRLKPIAICVTGTRYDTIERIARELGMRVVPPEKTWNILWTDVFVPVEKLGTLRLFQKINHFPGIMGLSHKDMLARNLARMQKFFPHDYDFFPKTWCLPADHQELLLHASRFRNRAFICKPEGGARGEGIFLTKDVKEIKLNQDDRIICQQYLSKPYLIGGYKFDLRIYVLITSCDPLRVYVYNEGIARFATSQYSKPTLTNISNVYMHLTNYAVNKYSRTYMTDEESGTKRRLTTLNRWFAKEGHDVQKLWENIDGVIMKTIFSIYPVLQRNYRTYIPSHDIYDACFELMGFDILLDHRLKPYLLEVNHSPSYHTETPLDCDLKAKLLTDTFTILNLRQYASKKLREEERKRIRERLIQRPLYKESADGNTESKSETKLDSPHRELKEKQIEWEKNHMGDFRQVYPLAASEDKYHKFFSDNLSTVYQATAATKVRQEATRQQREETELRAKLEASKCMENKSPKQPMPELKKATGEPKKRIPFPVQRDRRNSFEPSPILDIHENERIVRLVQRECIARELGLADVIDQILKNSKNRENSYENPERYYERDDQEEIEYYRF